MFVCMQVIYQCICSHLGSPLNPFQSWVEGTPVALDLPRLASSLTSNGGIATLLSPPGPSLASSSFNADNLLLHASTETVVTNHNSHHVATPQDTITLSNDDSTAANGSVIDIQNYSTASPSSDQCSMASDAEQPLRKRRHPVPDDKKDDKYWERRKRNNQAAKRSRDTKKRKTEDELIRAQDAIQENTKLKQEIEVLKAEISSLRRLLKDANMTLSLWIRARQASESAAQLPPMLRNPNMSFVTFPVPSTK